MLTDDSPNFNANKHKHTEVDNRSYSNRQSLQYSQPQDLKRRQTVCARSGVESDSGFGAIMPPIYLSSNFSFAGFNQPRQYDYSRSGNPTRDLLAQSLAELEGGAKGIVTSTGMSAILLVLQLLDQGSVLVFPHDCYGGSYRLFTSLTQRGLFKAVAVNFHQSDWQQQLESINPDMVWLETPSNPLLRITDIEAVADAAQSLDALLAVDNTVLSPLGQQPLQLGADCVVHSTTKYINGHSDIVGGAVITQTDKLGEKLDWWCNCLGIAGAPFDAFLQLRGIKTLSARLSVHEKNAQQIALFLHEHPLVKKVYYPGLQGHSGHKLALKQQSGFGALLSFELEAPLKAIAHFLESCQFWSLAESLGGVESLICHPATMTHAAMEQEARDKAGIGDNLIRLSVGIEHVDDLLSDLTQALQRLEGIIEQKGETEPERQELVSPTALDYSSSLVTAYDEKLYTRYP